MRLLEWLNEEGGLLAWLKKEGSFKEELFTQEKSSRSHDRGRKRPPRIHGTLRLATYFSGLGGRHTQTIEKNLKTSPDPSTSNTREKDLHQLFSGDSAALAYYLTFLTALPETHNVKIVGRLGQGNTKFSKIRDKMREFWEPEAERLAKKNGEALRTIQAGASSLAGIAGIRAKLKFQKEAPGGVKPWHWILFLLESKYNPIKWGEYYALRGEIAIKYFFQRGLNPKTLDLDRTNNQTVKKIQPSEAGLLRKQLYYITLLIWQSITFAISTLFNNRLYHFAKLHPYLFGTAFVVMLTIILLSIFFPPAAAIFLGFIPGLAEYLAALSIAQLIGWSVLSIYIAAACAKITSQLWESTLNFIADLSIVLTDKEGFLRRHPIIAIAVFVMAVTVLVCVIMLTPIWAALGSGVAAGFALAGAVYVAAILSCKIYHMVDYFKEKWEKRQERKKPSAIAALNDHQYEMKMLEEVHAARKKQAAARAVAVQQQQQTHAEVQEQEQCTAPNGQIQEEQQEQQIDIPQQIEAVTAPSTQADEIQVVEEEDSGAGVGEASTASAVVPEVVQSPINTQNPVVLEHPVSNDDPFSVMDEKLAQEIRLLEESMDDADNFNPSQSVLNTIAQATGTVRARAGTFRGTFRASRNTRPPQGEEGEGAASTSQVHQTRARGGSFRANIFDLFAQMGATQQPQIAQQALPPANAKKKRLNSVRAEEEGTRERSLTGEMFDLVSNLNAVSQAKSPSKEKERDAGIEIEMKDFPNDSMQNNNNNTNESAQLPRARTLQDIQAQLQEIGAGGVGMQNLVMGSNPSWLGGGNSNNNHNNQPDDRKDDDKDGFVVTSLTMSNGST